jgi:hypothetical protein
MSATGDPKPRKGNIQSTVRNKKVIETKNKLEFFNSIKYALLFLKKS